MAGEFEQSDWLRTIAKNAFKSDLHYGINVNIQEAMEIIDIGNCVRVAMSRNHSPCVRACMVAYFLQCEFNEFTRVEDVYECPGIYILWDDQDVLYVGQSINMRARIKSHRNIDYTAITAICTNEQDLIPFEAFAIGTLRPVNNFQYSSRYEPIISGNSATGGYQ